MEKMQRRPENEQQPDSKKPKLEMEEEKKYLDTRGKSRAERLEMFISHCLKRQKETFVCSNEIDEKGRREMTFEEFASYQLDIIETGGFDLGDYSNVSPMSGMIVPYYDPPAETTDDDDLAELTGYAQLAIEEFNNRDGRHYQNVIVLKSNVTVVQGLIYYMTFKATEQGNTETFQAKIYVGIPTTNIEIDMVRIRIPPKPIRIKLREGKQLNPVSTSISAV